MDNQHGRQRAPSVEEEKLREARWAVQLETAATETNEDRLAQDLVDHILEVAPRESGGD